MWGSLLNAAKGVWNSVTGSGSTPSYKPGIVTTFKLPGGNLQGSSPNLQGSSPNLQPTVSPQNPTTQPIQGTGAISQPGLTVQPIVTQAQLAAQAAAKQAQAQSAYNNQKGLIAGLWQKLLAPSTALAQMYGQRASKQQAIKEQNAMGGNLDTFIKHEHDIADNRVAMARQQLAQGKISATQYNALIDSENARLQKQAGLWNNQYQGWQKQLDAPYSHPGVAGAINDVTKLGSGVFGNIWKYTLGSGNKTVPSLVTAPGRVLNTFRNLANPQRPIIDNNKITDMPTMPKWSDFVKAHGGKGDAATLKAYNKTLSAWTKKYGQANNHYSPNILDRFKQAYQNSFNQSLIDPQNPYFQTKGSRFAGNIGLDPVNFVPVGGGSALVDRFGGRIADSPIGRTFGKVAGSKLGQFVGQLGAETRSANQKWLDKVNTKLGRTNDFKNLNSDELKAYSDLMQGQGTTWTKNIDRAKVEQLVKDRRSFFDAMHTAETRAGFGGDYKTGYLPTKQAYKGGDTGFSFLKSRAKAGAAEFTPTANDLYRAEAFRTAEHLRAMAQSGKIGETAALKSFRVGGKFKGIPKTYRGALEAANNDKFLTKLPPNKRFLSTDTSTIRNVAHMPTRAWKFAVLRANPAWYVHNFMWNVPASFLAGGGRTAGGYLKMLRAGEASLPHALTEGSFGGLGGKLENLSRGAAYHASRAKGMSQDEAVANVNKYLFNYGEHKNWEKPFRTVLPFWSWQKNIARLATQLPFDNSRAAQAFHQIDQNNQRQVNKIPAKGYSYTDPNTGKTTSFDPRKSYEGKVYVPGVGFVSAAGLPIMPSQLSQFGLNPGLSLAQRLFSGKDYFGKDVNGESWGQFFGSATPQSRLFGALSDMLHKTNSTEQWLSTSGYGKEAQGFDPTKPNYKASLDPTKTFFASLKSLSGVPFPSNFDQNKFRESMRYQQFSNDFFNHNWNKEFPDYTARQNAKTALAKKYGYDLQKDIYDGKWSAYDSPDTAALKERSKSAVSLQNQVYDLYNKMPKGTGDRSKFIQAWKMLMAGNDFLKFNPDFNVFKGVPIAANGDAKITSGGSSKGFGGGKSSQYAHTVTTKTGKSFTSFKTPAQERAAKIAWAYKNLPPDVRTGYLKKAGLTDPAKANWTTAQWDAYLKANGTDYQTKLGKDLVKFSDLGSRQIANVGDIVKSFQPTVKERRAVKWVRPGSTKRISYRQKALTFKA